MLTPLAITTYLLLSSFVLSRLNKSNILSTAPISVFFAMVWMTIFGILGDLEYGSISLAGFTLFSVSLIFVAPFKKAKLSDLKEIIDLQVILFVLLIFWSYLHSDGIKFYEWDEFTHWGTSVKSMFIFNVLGPESPISINNTNYLPGLSVLSYAAMQIEGVWDESIVFWAYQLILFSILFGIISRFTLKNIGKTFISLILLTLTSLVFYNPFTTVYADPLLALVFGYSLFLATEKKTVKNKFNQSYFIISVLSLYLIKEIGLLLGVISTSILFINQLFVIRDLRLKPTINFIKILILDSAIVMTIFGFKWLWFVYQCISDSGVQNCNNLSAFAVADNVIPNSVEPSSISSSQYLEVLQSRTLTSWNGLELSFFDWIWILVILLSLWIFWQSAERLRKTFIGIGLIFGSAMYAYAIYVAYKTSFGGTAPDFPSFERYIKTYLAGLAFFLAIVSVKQFLTNTFKKDISGSFAVPKLMLSMILIVTFASPQGFLVEFIKSPTQFADPMRNRFVNIDKKIELSQFNQDDRIYIITQHQTGYEFYYLRYAAIPGSAPFVPFSIGSKYGPGDYWTVEDITPEVWNKQLNDFDYVIIFCISDTFKEEFGSIFKDPKLIEEQTIYFVERSDQGNKLVKFI
jgi:hypothetical protein